ncbi:DUF4405 domain-containing protein [Klebsiella oxytoca]|uniref:DUF4405 domain-containing protein n=1 Tax=Klebsiella oxytoca TaxID=571 RepID=UPI00190EE692|nr:DUF4405 domain-containing protein [Klebsiella oxytoca]MBK0678720.1 DUF4405 domain-containing protein [Klebsiella oxytoca]
MKKKYIFQVWQDTALTIILLSLMGFHLWGENIHEWLGVSFLSIILLHNVLNVHWFKKIFHCDYTTFKIVQTIVNFILFILIFLAIISGLMLSRHVVPDMPFHSTTDFVRKTHMTSVHWGQIFIAVHLGLHWKMLATFFSKVWKIPLESAIAKYILPAIFIIIAVYGSYAFITREMLPYLLIQVDFAFFYYEESKWIFYMDYLAVLILFSYLTRYLSWVFIFRNKNPT